MTSRLDTHEHDHPTRDGQAHDHPDHDHQALGNQALGNQALGNQALGNQALGNQALGRRGEILAAEYLEGLGLTILDRNWRCRLGELDLVAGDGRDIVVVEVKTRRSLKFGDPSVAVTPQKQARLRRLAIEWLRLHPDARCRGTVRIDVVAVTIHGLDVHIRHIPGAC